MRSRAPHETSRTSGRFLPGRPVPDDCAVQCKICWRDVGRPGRPGAKRDAPTYQTLGAWGGKLQKITKTGVFWVDLERLGRIDVRVNLTQFPV